MIRFSKLRGNQPPRPSRPDTELIVKTWIGTALAIGAVGLATLGTQTALVVGSFGASCVLVFGFPDLPFGQPRNVALGHVLSSFTGLIFSRSSDRSGRPWRWQRLPP